MFAGKKILAIILARGGSKGLPRKNVLPLAGKPMLAWTIEASLGSQYVDATVVSTDDPEIAAIGEKFGASIPGLRPAELATDTATTVSVVRFTFALCEKIHGVRYDYVIVLQPTSPLRDSAHVDAAIELLGAKGAKSLASFCLSQANPYWMVKRNLDGTFSPLIEHEAVTRRQDLPRVYEYNGAIYIAARDLVEQEKLESEGSLLFEMAQNVSLDIDTLSDFLEAERIMRASHPPS